MSYQTEYEFTLPRGLPSGSGQLTRQGRMRLATAMDEISALHDPRVQENEAYLPVALLSRVIMALGDLPRITPQVVESLFASDLAYLEDLYTRLNSAEPVTIMAVCPHCSGAFELQVAPLE